MMYTFRQVLWLDDDEDDDEDDHDNDHMHRYHKLYHGTLWHFTNIRHKSEIIGQLVNGLRLLLSVH